MNRFRVERRAHRACVARALLLLGLVGGVVLPSPAQTSAASPTASDIAQELRRLEERQQLERSLQESRPDVRLQAPTPANGAIPTRLPTQESPCFKIERVELVGQDAPHFSWLMPHLSGIQGDDSPVGKCLGANGINVLLKRAQDAIVAKGFVTSRVLAQPQDISQGVLALSVMAGRVRNIRLAEPVSLRATAWNAVPVQPGDILNIRDIEQALENFKRVPTAEADIQITPSEGAAAQPGQSDLVISWSQRPNPMRVSVGADDSGSKATGKYQGSVTLSYDNWWTLNDLFYVTLNHDLGGGSPGNRGTRGHALHYSIPYGYWLLSLNASRNRYFQTVAGINQDYVYSGTSGNQDVELSRLFHRDATSKSILSVKALARQSSNFIDDTEIEVQRRRIGAWALGMTHRAYVGQATVDLGVAYQRGTGAFGSLSSPEEAFDEGTSRLALIKANAGLRLPFELAGRAWAYSGQWRLQSNRTPLTPQDRFAIGGRYTVRGFDGESSLSAERGWLVRNELSTPLGASGQQFFVGLDHGVVGGPSSDQLIGRRLTGAVIGLRGSVRDLGYEVFVGGPVSRPDGFRTASVTGGFNLNWSY